MKTIGQVIDSVLTEIESIDMTISDIEIIFTLETEDKCWRTIRITAGIIE